MKISMKEVGRGAVLAGALNGKAGLGRLLEATAVEPEKSEPLFIDFRGVDVATASYLRESVLALRNMIRGRDSQYYPVIANPNVAIRDELLELARTRGDVFMTCELAEDGKVRRPALVGDLEAKQRLTFDLVSRHGETDAGELMREYGKREKTRHATAWNNRLSALASLGLIVEQREGRLKRYRPLFQGVD
jgi:DNA-binding transcriptional ArsR family regulator